MDNVQCSSCGKRSVPRLWHVRPFLSRLRYMQTQHLCPFCGTCMYETGGEFTIFGKIVLVFLVLMFLPQVIMILLR